MPKAKLPLGGKDRDDSDTGSITSLSPKDKFAGSLKGKSNASSKISATSQTSRFHVDTLTTLSQEVYIPVLTQKDLYMKSDPA